MQPLAIRFLGAIVALGLFLPGQAGATDVDGPDDCTRKTKDFGDAPEGFDAYPGVLGHFPTCLAPTPGGTQQLACPAISTAPGQTGYVIHLNDLNGYWLGCSPLAPPQGIDSEIDGKSSPGTPVSACSDIAVDCAEGAFGMVFGQDECYGDNDAGIAAPVTFTTCTAATVKFRTFNCATDADRTVYLNILVDWNQDGDWNDSFDCAGVCAYEWAVKNVVIQLVPGCTDNVSPSFLAGPHAGDGWMRISISDQPAPDDFPWNGSAGLVAAGGALIGGETEDYPVTIVSTPTDPCDTYYQDFGDAPEELAAYPSGVIGHFPTCTAATGPGTQELACTPISSPPGATGYVEHTDPAGGTLHFWLGCGTGAAPTLGLDSEKDGKFNLSAAAGDPSSCDPAVGTDCVESAFGGMSFGQDECYGDGVDAGIASAITFTTCTLSSLRFDAYNCTAFDQTAFLNILVDWNEDGDWNDNFLCGEQCTYEWAVKNAQIVLPPGCNNYTSPTFMAGPNAGHGWLRITISATPVPDDFPWAGSAGAAGGLLGGGETEDYPVEINGGDPCDIAYEDFGDAPEEIPAYPTGVNGHFPTCLFAGAPGTQEIECGVPISLPPGPTGYVEHVYGPVAGAGFWFGCTAVAPVGVDGEIDGKVNLSAVAGDPSKCDPAVSTDCVEGAFGMSFGQDECYGDGVDAGVPSKVSFAACSTMAVPFRAYNCSPNPLTVILNVLVDWNQDGDWNDVISCGALVGKCAPEWAVKNLAVTLNPGCDAYSTPKFDIGPHPGHGWMRMTLTAQDVPDDFPWNGSAGVAGGAFFSGETEDYPVEIEPSTVGVGDQPIPNELQLGVSPNPSRDGATVQYGLARAANASVSVFDVSGRLVRQLVSGPESAGEHVVRWDHRDNGGTLVPVGLYLVKLEAQGQVLTRSLILVR